MLAQCKKLLSSCHWTKKILTPFLADSGPDYLITKARELLASLPKFDKTPSTEVHSSDFDKIREAIRLLNLAMYKMSINDGTVQSARNVRTRSKDRS